MSSFDGLQARALLAKGVVGQVADDQGVAVRLKKVSAGTVTSVTVTTGTGVVLVTSDGGTDSYTFAAYTTLGALADAINKDGIFEARVLDALRASASDDAIIDGAVTISSAGFYDLLSDTNGVGTLFLAYCLTPDRLVGVNTMLRKTHRVHLQEIVTSVTLGGGADAAGLKVYSRDLQSGTETLIMSKLPTSGSVATLNWASGQGKITGDANTELVVYISDATSITGFITVAGIIE